MSKKNSKNKKKNKLPQSSPNQNSGAINENYKNNQLQRNSSNQNSEVIPKNHQNSKIFAQLEVKSRRSPLPPPEDLAQYKQIYPGAAKIIFENFEKQGDHRREQENKIVNQNIKNSQAKIRESLLGQIFAFVLALFIIGIGAFIVIFNKNAQGFALILAPIAAIIGVFIYGKIKNNKNKSSSNKTLENK